jgi:TonB-dependent SusC/RagA subfamily outer membrane receptor
MKTKLLLVLFFCSLSAFLCAQVQPVVSDTAKNKMIIEPLYVLDGVAQDFSTNIKAKENFFKALKPTDIEAIQVLKDQNATEAYGEKGKNGVVIITTKNPKRKEG